MVKKRKGRRGGRPRKQNVAREPNGRISRSTEICKQAIYARMRLFGLTEKSAGSYLAGTVVGRMVMQGSLTRDQYDATIEYSRRRNAYQCAIGAKADYKEPRPDHEPDGDFESFCRKAKLDHAEMIEALSELCVSLRSPAPMSALDVFVVRDIYESTLEGDLRLALNRLVKTFFEAKKNAA